MQKFDVVTYDAIITLIPKSGLDDLELKALLAFLNSSFAQLYVETTGAVSLEVKHTEEMPILDIKNLKSKDIELLASLF